MCQQHLRRDLDSEKREVREQTSPMEQTEATCTMAGHERTRQQYLEHHEQARREPVRGAGVETAEIDG